MAQKIKNVHEKFTERENELRLTIINETVNNGRAFDLEEDKMEVLGKLQMDVKEYKEICEKLLEEDGMVLDGTKVNFIYPVSALPTNHRVTLQMEELLLLCVQLMQSELRLHFIRTQKLARLVRLAGSRFL